MTSNQGHQLIFTTSEVANMLRVDISTVRYWITTGQLKAYRVGRQYRITGQAIRDFVRPVTPKPR